MADLARLSRGAPLALAVARIFLLALTYYLVGRLGMLLTLPPSIAAPLWPAAGVALAAVLLWGPRAWPGVALGSLAVNLYVGFDAADPAGSAAFAAAMALPPAAQAVVTAWAIKRLGLFPSPLEEPREVLQTLAVGGAGSLVSPFLSNLLLCAHGATPWDAFVTHALTWYIGDAIGVLVFTPPLLLLGQDTPSRGRKLAVCGGLLAVFSISIAVFFQAQRFETRKRQYELDELNDQLAARLERQIEAYKNILQGLDSFLTASEDVSASEFAAFTAPFFDRRPEINALTWIANVADDERAAFEAAIRAQGFQDFAIKDRDGTGALTPAPRRARYYPVAFTAPYPRGGGAHGYDLRHAQKNGVYIRRRFLERARDAGETQATGAISLLRYGDQNGLLLFHPVYGGARTPGRPETRRRELLGFATGVFLLPGLLQEVRAEAADEHVHLILRDLGEPAAAPVIFDSRTPDFKAPAEPITYKRARPTSRTTIDIGGRTWEVRIVESMERALSETPWNLWYVLVSGILFSGLSGAYLLSVTARADAVRRLVDERTAALREREARLDAVISNSADGILTVDDRNRIETFNPACERIFGYAADELLGQRVERLIRRGCESCAQPRLGRGVSGGDEPDDDGGGETLRGWRRDDSVIDVEISAGGFDLEGRRHTTLIIRDVTDRRRAERERERLLDRLQRTNEELARFAYVASHDLQEPLRKIAIFSDLLDRRYREAIDDDGRKFLATIHAAALRMKALIHDLLAYSRTNSQTLAIERLSVAETVEQASEMLASSIEESGASIRVTGIETVEADSLLLRQLLQNLLSNAVKYRSEAPPEIVVSASLIDGEQRLSVSDNGVGFDPSYAERIFRAFERLHRKEEIEGTGIGLAVCERVARRLGGRIWAESTPGRGATFTLAWPAPRTEPANQAAKAPLAMAET